MCLKNTSAQLHTVSKSGSNGTSAALVFRPASECARNEFTFGRFCVHACRTFRVSGRGGTRRWTAGQLQTCPKATQVPKLTGERGGFARKHSILFSCCSKGRYAAGHVNLKEITARHNNDTNRCPAFPRLSPDLPVVPGELITVR